MAALADQTQRDGIAHRLSRGGDPPLELGLDWHIALGGLGLMAMMVTINRQHEATSNESLAVTQFHGMSGAANAAPARNLPARMRLHCLDEQW